MGNYKFPHHDVQGSSPGNCVENVGKVLGNVIFSV